MALKHAKYSASGSHRWLHCPASVALSSKAPPIVSGPWAEEGTTAHACLELVLKEHFHKHIGIEEIIEGLSAIELFDKEILSNIKIAANAISEMANTAQGAEVLIEKKVDLSFVYPNTFGTVDCALVEEFGTLTIVDLKYGAGVPVEARENSQLIFYALGLAHEREYNFSEIKLVIIQPRAESEENTPIKEWTFSIDELFSWKQKFVEGIDACEDPNAPFISGEHCRFCPAKAICPEISSVAMKKALIDFDMELGEIKLPALTDKTPLDFLPQALDASEKLSVWIKALKEAAFNALSRGERIPGWKLVEKRGTRKWIDPEKAQKDAYALFGENIFDTKLKTPASLQKIEGVAKKELKAFTKEYSTDISSGTTLVPESDPRPASLTFAENDFAEELKHPPRIEAALEESRKEKRKWTRKTKW